ncbi:hypothetical protein HK102_000876 [Quaeritorhiza haematococci]|nr:hypothetical protein HK102_000876 [Quaeritorhiza haematococci]
MTVGGDFYGTTEKYDCIYAEISYTENKEVTGMKKQREHPPKDVWKPNGAKFDSLTTQKHDYPSWPVGPPPLKYRSMPVPPAGKFEGESSNKADFRDWGVQPRYMRPQPVYMKDESKFDSTSSHREDFKDWKTAVRPQPRQQKRFLNNTDERDFKTTTSATFVGHKAVKNLVKGGNRSLPPPLRFEGSSTTQEDYKAWPVSPVQGRHKIDFTPNDLPFDGHTTYGETFDVKHVEPVSPYGPKYVTAAPLKFEGTSTQKTDYLAHALPPKDRPRPRALYQPGPEDRDFATTTSAEHTIKILPRCKVMDWVKMPTENKNGHLFLTA